MKFEILKNHQVDRCSDVAELRQLCPEFLRINFFGGRLTRDKAARRRGESSALTPRALSKSACASSSFVGRSSKTAHARCRAVAAFVTCGIELGPCLFVWSGWRASTTGVGRKGASLSFKRLRLHLGSSSNFSIEPLSFLRKEGGLNGLFSIPQI